MANMAKRQHAGSYVIGIYTIERERGAWQVRGHGWAIPQHMGSFPTLDAAHRYCTAEGMHD